MKANKLFIVSSIFIWSIIILGGLSIWKTESNSNSIKMKNKIESGYNGVLWGSIYDVVDRKDTLESACSIFYGKENKIRKDLYRVFVWHDAYPVITDVYKGRRREAIKILYEFYEGKFSRVILRYDSNTIKPQELLNSIRKKYGKENTHRSKEVSQSWLITKIEEIFIWENDTTIYAYSYLKDNKADKNGGDSLRIDIICKKIKKDIDDKIKNTFKEEEKKRMIKKQQGKDSILKSL